MEYCTGRAATIDVIRNPTCVQHCLVEEALGPNVFHHVYHRKFLLDKVSAALVRACLFDEVLEHEIHPRYIPTKMPLYKLLTRLTSKGEENTSLS